MTNKWIKTDDFQYLRKLDSGVYELIEANYVDGKYAISEADKVIIDGYLDEDGNYNAWGVDIISGYYGLKSGDPVKDFEESVTDPDTREQYFAEMAYESTSHLMEKYGLVSEDDAEKILEHYTATGEYLDL